MDENALLAFPEGTVFVVGEGESALTAIVDQAARAVPADAPIEGTVFCGHAGLVRSARPAQSIPPEALPSPILSRTLRPASTDWIPSYATTRGCVFNCSFCAWQDGFREREFPLDQVFAELDVLAGEGHDRIWITDTIFGRNAERGAAILRRIQDWPGSTRFALELHAHYLPDVLVDEIARVPLAWAAVGIQSLAPDVLRLTRRSPHTGRLLDAVGRLYDRLPDRSALHLDVICGLPGQTAEDCFQTVDLLLEQFPEATIFTGMLQILPGTSLERLRGEPGWVVLPPEADGEVLLTPHIDAADMRRIRDLLVGLDAYSLARPTGQRAVTAASLEALGRGLRGTRFAAHPLYGRRERFATSGADGFPDTDD